MKKSYTVLIVCAVAALMAVGNSDETKFAIFVLVIGFVFGWFASWWMHKD